MSILKYVPLAKVFCKLDGASYHSLLKILSDHEKKNRIVAVTKVFNIAGDIAIDSDKLDSLEQGITDDQLFMRDYTPSEEYIKELEKRIDARNRREDRKLSDLDDDWCQWVNRPSVKSLTSSLEREPGTTWHLLQAGAKGVIPGNDSYLNLVRKQMDVAVDADGNRIFGSALVFLGRRATAIFDVLNRPALLSMTGFLYGLQCTERTTSRVVMFSFPDSVVSGKYIEGFCNAASDLRNTVFGGESYPGLFNLVEQNGLGFIVEVPFTATKNAADIGTKMTEFIYRAMQKYGYMVTAKFNTDVLVEDMEALAVVADCYRIRQELQKSFPQIVSQKARLSAVSHKPVLSLSMDLGGAAVPRRMSSFLAPFLSDNYNLKVYVANGAEFQELTINPVALRRSLMF